MVIVNIQIVYVNLRMHGIWSICRISAWIFHLPLTWPDFSNSSQPYIFIRTLEHSMASLTSSSLYKYGTLEHHKASHKPLAPCLMAFFAGILVQVWKEVSYCVTIFSLFSSWPCVRKCFATKLLKIHSLCGIAIHKLDEVCGVHYL